MARRTREDKAGEYEVEMQHPHELTDEKRTMALEQALGRQLREFRKSNNPTVSELSAVSRVSLAMISKIENGQAAGHRYV